MPQSGVAVPREPYSPYEDRADALGADLDWEQSRARARPVRAQTASARPGQPTRSRQPAPSRPRAEAAAPAARTRPAASQARAEAAAADRLEPPRSFGEYRAAGEGMPARRTVTIRGQGSERYVSRSSRSRPERRHERAGFRPDRTAMWAVLLCVLMILVAVSSAHAATLGVHLP